MYLPSHFAESRPEVLHQLMRQHPLATVVWADAEGLHAEHLPLEFEAGAGAAGLGVLRGHVARANPVWQRCSDGQLLLAIFQGPQCYISPSLYPSKALDGRVVPTWNYAIVQVHGTLRIQQNPAWLLALVNRLTDTHERPREQPWSVDDAPADYIAGMCRAIVGLELEVTALTGKWKVSQNRPVADRAGVVDGLTASAMPQAMDMAALVAAHLPDRTP